MLFFVFNAVGLGFAEDVLLESEVAVSTQLTSLGELTPVKPSTSAEATQTSSSQVNRSVKNKQIFLWNSDYVTKLGQYHEGWCLGSLQYQVISNHDFDYI